jgi:CBS domain-containing protein
LDDALQKDLSLIGPETQIGRLIRRSPLTCPPDAPLRVVFQQMHAGRVGSIVVVDDDAAPMGILTRYDLISRIILPSVDLQTPIEQVMSKNVICAPAQQTVLEAMIQMASHGIRHLPVLEDDGRLVGVLSESDLMAHQRQSLRSLSAMIAHAASFPELAAIGQDIRRLAQRLFQEGLSATAVAKLMSHLNDAMTVRVIDLVRADSRVMAPPTVPWAWLALGSEGRDEQTIATDQDNAIVFDGDEVLAPLFQDFARAVNEGLDAVGFPLCKGGVMAQHAKWCRPLAHWRDALGEWFERPSPERILDAHIFLDFRALYGDRELVGSLRSWVTEEVRRHPSFLRAMAQDAIRSGVGELPNPVFFSALARWLRSRNIRADWLSPPQLDIKKSGTAPVVAWTRVLALMNGVAITSTDGRLAALQRAGKLQLSESQAIREAFDLAQRYRLRAQLQGHQNPNALELDPLSLHELEALRVALDDLSRLRSAVTLDLRL